MGSDADGSGLDADLAFVGSGMVSKYPVTLKDGTEVRPIDVFVATLPPNPPADELARLALAGEIIDFGVVTVDCIGEKDGKPASVNHHHRPARHQVRQRARSRARTMRLATAPPRRPRSTPR